MRQYDRAIQRAIEWIEARLHEEISADDVADRASFSKYHFHRIFQARVGMSITAYIRMRRLANAAVALIHTNVRILDMAMDYRFESQEAFTRAFKKMYRLPPGQYRKLMAGMATAKEEKTMKSDIRGWLLSGSHPYN